jgi:hypothetical protein
MDASHLALLVPVSKHGKSRESYSTLQHYFSASGCTVIFGLDEEALLEEWRWPMSML